MSLTTKTYNNVYFKIDFVMHYVGNKEFWN